MTRTPALTRQIYLAISCLLAATAVWGFWPGYFAPLLRGGVQHFWFIHLHAGVFLGWMILLVVQAVCVASGKVALHRTIGSGGIFVGVLVIAVGAFISVAAPLARLAAGQLQVRTAEVVVLYNLTDMVVFSVLFALAIAFRARPGLHRRLIVCAGNALTGAAVGRMLASDSLAYLVVWLAPLAVAMAADLAVERRIHPVFVCSGAAFAFMFLKVDLFARSELAHAIGRLFIAPFL